MHCMVNFAIHGVQTVYSQVYLKSVYRYLPFKVIVYIKMLYIVLFIYE